MTKTLLKSLALVSLCAATGLAQGLTVKEDKPGLLKRAKVAPAAAQAAAQAKVPGGTIKSAEIEEENGKLIYSFDIVTKGKSGVDEVNVDAMTGTVDLKHESPADEAKEKAQDAAKAAARKAPKGAAATPKKP